MASGVEKLFFRIGLIDNLTGPAKTVTKQISAIQRTANSGFSKIMKGGLGLAAVGYTIDKLVSPALEDMKASAEIKSLGVLDKDLAKLEKTANSFALEFGVDDDDFVRSAANIKRSMPWITDGLADYTRNANLLAKATGTDADTTATYLGKMTNIFDDLAKKTGEKQWGEALIGMTAETSRIFNTDVNKISDGFTKIGAVGERAGVSLSEQFAVIGSLQNLGWDGKKLGGYKDLLTELTAGGNKFGMSFIDAKGAALPLFEVIDKLKTKFGDTLDPMEVEQLNKAFGTGANVIVAMYNKTDKLQESIGKLNAASTGGMKTAADMAKANTTPLERVIASVNQIREAFSYAILSAIGPFIEGFASLTAKVTNFLGEYPTLSKVIGGITVGVIGITAAISAFTLAMGVVNMIKTACLTFKMLSGVIKLCTISTWNFNAALLANPLGLVFLGVSALLLGIGALFYWYEDLEKALSTSTWGIVVLAMIDMVLAPFRMLKDLVVGIYNLFTGNWGTTWGQSTIGTVKEIGSWFKWLMDICGSLKQGISDSLSYASDKMSAGWDGVKKYSGYDWVKEQLGFSSEAETADPTKSNELEKSRQLDVPAGGVINNSASASNVNYGGVKIYTSKAFGPSDMEEWNLLHGGV